MEQRITIESLAAELVASHLSDPLVRAAGASPDDVDMFDGVAADLRLAGLPNDRAAVVACRSEIRRLLVALAHDLG